MLGFSAISVYLMPFLTATKPHLSSYAESEITSLVPHPSLVHLPVRSVSSHERVGSGDDTSPV